MPFKNTCWLSHSPVAASDILEVCVCSEGCLSACPAELEAVMLQVSLLPNESLEEVTASLSGMGGRRWVTLKPRKLYNWTCRAAACAWVQQCCVLSCTDAHSHCKLVEVCIGVYMCNGWIIFVPLLNIFLLFVPAEGAVFNVSSDCFSMWWVRVSWISNKSLQCCFSGAYWLLNLT